MERLLTMRRQLRPVVRGGWRAVFAIGPAYEQQPLGPGASFDQSVVGYYRDLRKKTLTLLAKPRCDVVRTIETADRSLSALHALAAAWK
jgi:hypothetical protein